VEVSSRVQAVVDYYGPTDLVQRDAHAHPSATFRHGAPDSPESRLIGGPIQDPSNSAKVQRANPISHVTTAAPPFLIVHGDADGTVTHHQRELLHDALIRAGVRTHFVTVKGGGHGRGFPNPLLMPLVADFFACHLQGGPTAAEWPAAVRSSVNALATATTP
jgi:acetyl esterase/lipase